MAGDAPVSGSAPVERCGQCGAPAAHEQRYCLNCGFHRRNAPDPVSRYLSEASAARAAVVAATALATQRRRNPRIGMRLVVTLVLAALLIGVLIGNTTAGHSAAPARAKSQQTAKTHQTSKKHSTVKNATGSSYLQQEQNLPNSVTP
jgi:hypothetical protein